ERVGAGRCAAQVPDRLHSGLVVGVLGSPHACAVGGMVGSGTGRIAGGAQRRERRRPGGTRWPEVAVHVRTRRAVTVGPLRTNRPVRVHPASARTASTARPHSSHVDPSGTVNHSIGAREASPTGTIHPVSACGPSVSIWSVATHAAVPAAETAASGTPTSVSRLRTVRFFPVFDA